MLLDSAKSRSADASTVGAGVYHPQTTDRNNQFTARNINDIGRSPLTDQPGSTGYRTAEEEPSAMRKLDGFARNATSDWWADMLARRTGESVWIGELLADQVHIVHQAARPGDLVQDLGADGTIPWYACALGQAIVAGLDQAAREALLAVPASRLTGMTVTDAVQLRQILALTRDRGYAVEAHGATLGDAGIAAPVLDAARRVVAAVGIVGPAERLLPAEHQQSLVHAVCITARALSEGSGLGTPPRDG
jgi:hypothetical protein